MIYHIATSPDEYQKLFYEQIGLKKEISNEFRTLWNNPKIGHIDHFGSNDTIQCGIGNYTIPLDFVVEFSYSTTYLHLGIVYEGITYSMKSNCLQTVAIPSAFLAIEETSGGTNCWKRGQHFKGIELSIEFEYLNKVLLPLLGYSESALDGLEHNIRYLQIPDEILSVIHLIERTIESGDMTQPLLFSFGLELLSYLLHEKNQNFFNYSKKNFTTCVTIGKRVVKLTSEDFKKIIQVHEQIEKNATSFHRIYDLSQANNISEQKLKAGFRKFYNQTLWDYANSIRMNHAVALLGDSTLSISEISKQIGYQSQAAFLRVFKRFSGITPNQFRTQLHNSKRLR